MRLGQECTFVNNPLQKWDQSEVTIANAVTWYGEYVHYMLNRLMVRGVRVWMEPLVASNTEFRLLPSDPVWFNNIERTGDIIVRSEYMDGPGGVLGYVPLPTNSDDVGSCERCGDVFMDQWESWTARMWYAFWLHEFGHAMGLPHSERRDSIMYPQFQGQTELGPTDVASVVELYERAA